MGIILSLFKSHWFINYLSSGWTFSEDEYLLKQRFYLLNIVVALGFFAVGQGIVYDFYFENYTVLLTDFAVFFFFLGAIIYLRRNRESINAIASASALISLIYLDFLILISTFEDMEFVWLFFFVVTFMFLKGPKLGSLWNFGLFISLLLLKVQTFHPIDFTYMQISYLIFSLFLVSMLTYSFHLVIDENYDLIFKQRQQLKSFNEALEMKVAEQTNALRKLNESLNETIESKVAEVHEQQEMLITQSRLAAMGEMLSMIAHQWRQPLSTTTLRISNMQIKSMMDDEKNDERDVLLEEVSDTLVYLSNTIDDFQTYFKPEHKSERANVAGMMERAKNFVKARADIYNIEMVCSGNAEVEIDTFPNEMIQVVINILNNAVDVIISSKASVKQITLEASASDENVFITITDSGEGIKEELLERVFEPYFSTKSENGTGLGLYMAKMIIEEHMKGQISVVNAPEGGARFVIEVPLYKEI